MSCPFHVSNVYFGTADERQFHPTYEVFDMTLQKIFLHSLNAVEVDSDVLEAWRRDADC